MGRSAARRRVGRRSRPGTGRSAMTAVAAAGTSSQREARCRRVVGVVTLRDLLGPVLADGPAQTTGPFHRHEHQLTGYQVRELMTAEPVTAGADSALAKAVLAMDQAGVNRIPVVDLGRPPDRHPHPRRRAAQTGPTHPPARSPGRRRFPDGAGLTQTRWPGRDVTSARLLSAQDTRRCRGPASSPTVSSSPHRRARSASPLRSGPAVPST